MLESGNEGYVTFTSDEVARRAFEMEDFRSKFFSTFIKPEIRINIACVRHQPEWQPYTPPILELCDDVLYMIFDRCDIATLVNSSETCVRFNNLLEKQYRFPKFDKILRIQRIQLHGRNLMTFTDLHKMLRLMGRHFTKLEFFSCNEQMNDSRFLQEIVKYCTNVRYMEFTAGLFRKDFIRLLEPIFNRLNTFEIIAYKSEVNSVADIKELLPKSVKIKTSLIISILRCLDCKVMFNDKSTLLRHIKTKHNEMKLYECYLCNFWCIQIGYLKEHMSMH